VEVQGGYFGSSQRIMAKNIIKPFGIDILFPLFAAAVLTLYYPWLSGMWIIAFWITVFRN